MEAKNKKKELTGFSYKTATLCINGKLVTKRVHRLVAEAFIENPLNLPQINHIDGNPLNNSVKNLEWCTNQQNVFHARKNGLVHSYKEDKKCKYCGDKIGDSNKRGSCLRCAYKHGEYKKISQKINIDEYLKFLEEVREELNKSGMSYKDLATELGYSYLTIFNYLECKLTSKVIDKKVIEKFGISGATDLRHQ